MLPLEDYSCAKDLLPFTAIRSVLDIRMGILTFREKWARLLGVDGFALVSGGPALPANILPTRALATRISRELARGPLTKDAIDRLIGEGRLIRYPWHILVHNAEAIAEDFALIAGGRKSMPLPPTVGLTGEGEVFIEAGARISQCLLNPGAGPIYIGRNAEIMEGSMIRGPFACGEGAVVKMGTKIYGATTLGPRSIAGGEIKNTVFFGFSNKGHDGYLGDSVIGEWCNLGAGTSASNVKNNAGVVKVFHPASGDWLAAGQKCGLFMGDFSRSAINTSFNTGTVTGICCNIFGETVPPKYIPDFSWGQDGRTRYEWDKALRDIRNWMKMKDHDAAAGEIAAIRQVYDQL